MQHARTLIVVLFLAILAVAGFWMLRADDTGPVAPPAGANTAQAGNDGGDSAAADAAQGGIGAVSETTARVAAPPLEAGARAAAGPGIVGQVLDERSNAVAGAVVTLTPGFGGADFDGGEEFDFETAFDGDAWRERLANSRRERTETTTDGEGRFRLAAGGRGSNLQLRVRAPSHVVFDKGVARPVGKDTDLGVLTLKSGATVSGRVLDRAGSPVVGARVSREAAGNHGGSWGDMEFPGFDELADTMEPDSGATDAEGRFALPYCAPGKFALRARHVDHPSARLDGLAVEAGATLADVVIVADPGASIRGRIVGVPEGSKPLRVMASLKPAEGANEPGSGVAFGPFGDTNEMLVDAGMGFGEKQVRSNADFTFELRGLRVGKTYRIWAAQSGRGFAGNAVCTQRSEAAAGTAGLELRYDPGITVTFQVVAAGTGAPIERLWVRDQLRGGGGMDFSAYMPRSGRAKVYPEGKVTIANLRPKPKQTLSLTVEALGFLTLERKDIALPVTGAHDLGTVRLEPAPVLQVTVTSGPDRRAVAGANVRVSAADRGGKSEQPFGEFQGIVIDGSGVAGMGGGTRTAKTDREGRCTINALPGAMVVSVSSKEFAPYASEPITLPAGESGSHEVALVRGGSVEVTVVDSAGAVLKEARVEHAPPAGGRSSKQTNQDGVALFEHLGPGEHRFRLDTQGDGGSDFGPDISFGPADRKQADEPGWQQLAVEDGGKATLQIAKDPMASLRGIVRENGLPLAGARVSFTEGVADPAAQGEVPVFAEAMEGFGGASNRSARTGDDGTYKLDDLPAGAHRLRITAKGRVSPTLVTLALRQGENVVDIDLDVTIVRGTVRDGAGKPVAGASVSIVAAAAGSKVGEVDVSAMFEGLAGLEAAGFGGGRSAVKTGDDGRYELRGVQAGKPLQVRAAAKGHAAAKSAVVEVAQGTARDGVDVQLGAAGRIKVTVADAPAFATVQATLLGAGGEPDAAVGPVMQMLRRGAVTLDGLRPGKWKVALTTPGGAAHEPRLVDVVAGETATLAF